MLSRISKLLVWQYSCASFARLLIHLPVGSSAGALGAERTRDELVPFLAGIPLPPSATSFVSFEMELVVHTYVESVEDEDEVVSVIAENVGECFSFLCQTLF